MENQTGDMDVLQLEALTSMFSLQSSVVAFVLLLLVYIFIMVAHVGLLVLISVERSLHEPMYLLFCNMSVNDVLGATVVVPHILRDIFKSERSIYYVNCAFQAFFVHFYAATCHTVLVIMSFDRYVAICNPLRYATIMTHRMVAKLSALAWSASFIIIMIAVSLSVRLSRCRRAVFNPFCDNPSLFKLSCDSLVANHIYGLISAIGTVLVSLGSVLLTYLRIAMVCLKSNSKAVNSKALQTCATHLTVYIILFVSGNIVIILHRYPNLTNERKLAAILFHVVPTSMNAVIYGLQIKAVREKIIVIFKRNKTGVER